MIQKAQRISIKPGANTVRDEALALCVRGVSKSFGGLQALKDIDLDIARGSIHGLIGPNGAGKTTFFNIITGLYTADSGDFKLLGKSYSPAQTHEVARAGIARTFQNIRLFKEMTALENVMVGRHIKTHSGVWAAILKTSSFKREEHATQLQAYALLDYVGIESLAKQRAKTLSYGDQRRLEIARALATDPYLLALDEPAAGMNGTEKKELKVLIEKIRRDNKTVLLIEHDVQLVMGLCDQLTVLDYGTKIAEGSAEQIQKNPLVIQAYLGTKSVRPT